MEWILIVCSLLKQPTNEHNAGKHACCSWKVTPTEENKPTLLADFTLILTCSFAQKLPWQKLYSHIRHDLIRKLNKVVENKVLKALWRTKWNICKLPSAHTYAILLFHTYHKTLSKQLPLTPKNKNNNNIMWSFTSHHHDTIIRNATVKGSANFDNLVFMNENHTVHA